MSQARDDPASLPPPSATSLPHLAVDSCPDELASDDVARTASVWRTPLTSTATFVGLTASVQGPVVLDRQNPASPLIEETLQQTQAVVDATDEDHLDVFETNHNVPLDVSNLQRTVPGQWFTDNVISGYINLLRRRQAHRRRADGRAQRMWFFNTFFYSRMPVCGCSISSPAIGKLPQVAPLTGQSPRTVRIGLWHAFRGVTFAWLIFYCLSACLSFLSAGTLSDRL